MTLWRARSGTGLTRARRHTFSLESMNVRAVTGGVALCGCGFRVDALAGGDAVEKPAESPEVLLGGDVAGHGGCRCYDSGELAGRGVGERLAAGGYLFRRGWRAGLVQVGDIQGDRAEHVAKQQVGRARGVVGGEASISEELEEPFTQSQRVRAGPGLADHQSRRAGMGSQPRPQFDGEGFHALPPWLSAVGEDAVVDLTEQALDQGPDDGGLIREVGVYRVRGYADLGGDAPHRRPARPALVEQLQRGVEDLVLGQGAPGAGAPPLARCCHWAAPPLDFFLDSVQYLYDVQILYGVKR